MGVVIIDDRAEIIIKGLMEVRQLSSLLIASSRVLMLQAT